MYLVLSHCIYCSLLYPLIVVAHIFQFFYSTSVRGSRFLISAFKKMSVAFVPQNVRNPKTAVSSETIQKLLDENCHLIQCIADYQSKGKMQECAQYQQVLHRNLVWLATVADSNQSGGQQSMMSGTPAPGKDPVDPTLPTVTSQPILPPVVTQQPTSYPNSSGYQVPNSNTQVALVDGMGQVPISRQMQISQTHGQHQQQSISPMDPLQSQLQPTPPQQQQSMPPQQQSIQPSQPAIQVSMPQQQSQQTIRAPILQQQPPMHQPPPAQQTLHQQQPVMSGQPVVQQLQYPGHQQAPSTPYSSQAVYGNYQQQPPTQIGYGQPAQPQQPHHPPAQPYQQQLPYSQAQYPYPN
ncbi:uncharacterized protein LOC143448320 [Clavelina lepadiformis]|uniref:uncharacterized protein LOC143448320 n=1 Tax=Clavelina lepadiformis TaxID=159417 RepID=UPI004042CE97